MSKMKTLKLERGIGRGEKTLDSVQLREATAGDMRGLKLLDVLQFDVDALAKLLPRISQPALVEQEVYQFTMTDLAGVMNIMADFTETSTKPRIQ